MEKGASISATPPTDNYYKWTAALCILQYARSCVSVCVWSLPLCGLHFNKCMCAQLVVIIFRAAAAGCQWSVNGMCVTSIRWHYFWFVYIQMQLVSSAKCYNQLCYAYLKCTLDCPKKNYSPLHSFASRYVARPHGRSKWNALHRSQSLPAVLCRQSHVS